MDIQQLSDLYEIQVLKAQYFRFMDTKQWDEFRDLFTADMQLFIEDAPSRNPMPATFPSRGRAARAPDRRQGGRSRSTKATCRRSPSSTPTTRPASGPCSTGSTNPGRGGAWQGYGHYHERYTRGTDGKWRIAEVRFTRLRSNTVEPKPSESSPATRAERRRLTRGLTGGAWRRRADGRRRSSSSRGAPLCRARPRRWYATGRHVPPRLADRAECA